MLENDKRDILAEALANAIGPEQLLIFKTGKSLLIKKGDNKIILSGVELELLSMQIEDLLKDD